MTDGEWEWATDPRFPLWCVTFTRHLAPDKVLRRYGADARTARMLARGEASGLYDLALRGGTVLRAGTAGGWSFCYEDVGGAGSRPGVLGALSRGTETLSLLHGGDGTNHLAQCPRRTEDRLRPGLTDPSVDRMPGQDCVMSHWPSGRGPTCD
ncbi:DUF6461 domain-containing protein [Streptomyces sp. NPDC059575]|uniref:DUF6461 domain-containing protein n=1 Tax=Streptomyces sp. NPDC059575 TaxID=3346872 RepID=UPI00367A84F5